MYATAASELAFAKYADEIIHENIYSYIFTKPSGETLATLWNIEKQQQFAWKLPSGSKVRNMYGRELTGKPLEIGPSPLYITIPKPAKTVASMIRSAMAENARSFDCASVPGAVFVRSFLKKAQDAEIQTAGQAVKVRIMPEKVNVFHVEAGDGAELICGEKRYAIRYLVLVFYNLTTLKKYVIIFLESEK